MGLVENYLILVLLRISAMDCYSHRLEPSPKMIKVAECTCNLHRKENDCGFWFAFLRMERFLKSVYSKTKEFAPPGKNIFHFRVVTSLECVTTPLYIPRQLFYTMEVCHGQIITKTRLFKYIENFKTKKGKFSDKKKSDIFHISAQNIDCGYSLEPPRRGGSSEYPQSMFLAK